MRNDTEAFSPDQTHDMSGLDWLAAFDPIFSRAERVGTRSAWWQHVPFGHWIVCTARPRVAVELGTHTGVSYSAFCEPVVRAGLDTRCYAVDAWRGDAHAGTYGEEVLFGFPSPRATRRSRTISATSLKFVGGNLFTQHCIVAVQR
jgi:hypothetical protein